ncbi:MAG TPA: hypothetical protein PLU24_01905 [Candidatus Omnitrophota bacterium]|nr:hypothetical protein [Candidatus Omnitrophota bacterium]
MRKKIIIEPISWQKGCIRIIDQTRLPIELKYEDLNSVSGVWHAIKKLKVRGAPLIGIAGALGFLLGFEKIRSKDKDVIMDRSKQLHDYLASSRPTAVNLFWALERMMEVVRQNSGRSLSVISGLLKSEVEKIIDEDVEMCFKMSEFGSGLIKTGDNLMTVCNAGALATSGYGTALGVFYRAYFVKNIF